MADKRITDLDEITSIGSEHYIAVDNTTGTNKSDKVKIKTTLKDEMWKSGGTQQCHQSLDLAGSYDINYVSNLRVNDIWFGAGTGALTKVLTTAEELNKLDGLTAVASELNVLDGFTGNAADVERLSSVDSALMGKDENQAVNRADIILSTTILGSGNYKCNTTSGGITISLPQISSTKSEEIIIYLGTGTNSVTIRDSASDSGFVKHDGVSKGNTIILDSVGEFVYLKSSSIQSGYWMILGGDTYTLTTV